MNESRGIGCFRMLVWILAVCIATGCIKKTAPTTEPAPEPESEEPKTRDDEHSQAAMEVASLDLAVVDEPEGIRLRIQGQPSETVELVCVLDDRRLDDKAVCGGEGRLASLNPGPHTWMVFAKGKDGRVLAIGDGAFEVGGQGTSAAGGDLSLTFQTQGWSAGGNVVARLGKDLEVEVRWTESPRCEKGAEVQCSLEREGQFQWIPCPNGMQHKIPAGALSLGRQYVAWRGVCGDRIGPTLLARVDGVLEGYEPLALFAVRDNSDRQVFALQREADCPLGLLVFECSETVEDRDFLPCVQGNVVDAASSKAWMRARCEDRKGHPIEVRKGRDKASPTP